MKKLAITKDRQANLQRKINRIPENSQAKEALIDFYTNYAEEKLRMEADPKWQKNNMEYDLRVSEYIVEKCKDKMYAQNMYSALCNNEFLKNDVMPILLEETWGCSWRYAGGIVADLRGEGDYLDWYCTGIRGDEEVAESPDQPREYVGEGTVTDEIREDLFKIGWIVIDSEE